MVGNIPPLNLAKLIIIVSYTRDDWLNQGTQVNEWDSTWKQYTEWDIGDWSQCSSTCGESYRHREVRCIRNDILLTNMDEGAYQDNASLLVVLDDLYCDNKPKAKESCETGPCPPEWITEEWTQVSK